MKSISMLVVAAAAALLCSQCLAKEYFVDRTRPDDSGDGESVKTAKRTIQAAVALATQNGDVVTVLPGIYDEGGAIRDNYSNRVHLATSGVTLRSLKGSAITHIVGSRDLVSAVDTLGNGPKAVRCVLVDVGDVVVEGFTIRDGAAHPATAKENTVLADGGGVRVVAGKNSSIVDCVVSNCVGVRGGAMRYGAAVRCRIVENLASVKGSAGNVTKFVNCLVEGNSVSGGPTAVGGTSVNSTFARNRDSYVFSESAKAYNCVLTMNAKLSDASKTIELTKCVIVANGSMYDPSGVPYFKTLTDCTTNAPACQYVAPIFGDWRLIEGCAAIGHGDVSYFAEVALPAGVDAYKSFDGVTFGATDTINAGAFQRTGTTQGGGMAFDSRKFKINGVRPLYAWECFFATNWPVQYRIDPLPDAGEEFYGLNSKSPRGGTDWNFPLMDGTLYLMPPESGVLTNNFHFTSNIYYADPNAAAGGDGSQSAPFRTLQAAVDQCPSNQKGIVHAAAGDYDSEDGVNNVYGMTNRVSMGTKVCRIIGAGAGASTIYGKLDNEFAASGDGRGPAAIRCVSFDGDGACVQGFTLRDGRCGYTGNGTDAVNEHSGAAMFAKGIGTRSYLVDCVITNCLGYRGCVYGGSLVRTTITDSGSHNGGVSRYARLISCLVFGNCMDASAKDALGSNSEAYGSTFIGSSKSNSLMSNNAIATNCLFMTCKSVLASMNYGGCYAWDINDSVPSGVRLTVADPQFRDAAANDFRLLTTSPAYGGGVWGPTVCRFYSPDVEGRPLAFRNGLPTAGAVHCMVQAVVAEGGGGAAFSPSGTIPVEQGESVTVVCDETSATRPVCGLKVNGEDVGWPAGGAWTFTAPSGVATETFTVTPAFSTNWYVNANAADNSGNGFRPETAKQSFHGEGGLFTVCPVAAGDCVHAAAGTYTNGVAMSAPSSYVGARLAVPINVAVVADEGPEKTFIVGAPANSHDAHGRGDDAVRGVYLRQNSRIKGFTVTGGATQASGSDANETYGGGVLSYNGTGLAENCIISNNAAVRGGGVHRGRYVNCRFFYNYASANRSAASEASLYGCVLDKNYGVNMTQNCYATVNCTLGPDAWKTEDDETTKTACIAFIYYSAVNSIVLGAVSLDSAMSTKPYDVGFTNCVFLSSSFSGSGSGQMAHVQFENCITTNAEAIVLDPNTYAPVYGSCAAIDAGRNDRVSSLLAGGDVNGGQRIYNGTVDAGAVECDFRPIYKAALGLFTMTIDEASPGVVLTDGGAVRLADGETLAATISREGRYTLGATVADGVLSGDLCGTELLADAPGRWRFRCRETPGSLALSFAGEGYADLAPIAGPYGTIIFVH